MTTRELKVQYTVTAKGAGELRRAIGDIERLDRANKDLADRLRKFEADARGATNSVDKLGDELQQTGDQASTADKKMDDFGSTMFKASTLANLAADAMQEIGRAIVEFTKESAKAYLDYEDETRRVFAQIPELSAAMRDSLSRDARVIATEIGYLPSEVLPTLRKAMNLGISEDNIMSAIETAAMAARIGGSDLTETLVLGQSVVNAYGEGIYTLSESFDLLNFITQNTNLEFTDLTAGMNQIISPAAEAGLALDDVAAAMIVMNRQGDDMNEIVDLLGPALTRLSIGTSASGKAFKEIAGVDFREYIASGHDVVDAMQLITDHSEETGIAVVNIMGGDSSFYADMQAARAIAELTGRHLGELAEAADGTAGAVGTLSAASKEFTESDTLAVAQMEAAYESLKIEAGEAALSIATSAGLIEGAMTYFKSLSGDTAHQVGQYVDASMDSAEATGEWAEQMDKLVTSSNAVTGVWWFNSVDKERAGLGELNEAIGQTVQKMAESGAAHWEVRQAMSELDKEQRHLIPTFAEYQVLLDGVTTELELLERQELAAANATAVIASHMTNAALAAQVFDSSIMRTRHAFKDAQEEAQNFVDVVSVLDGDTVKIDLGGEIQTLRFANINAPEIAHELGEEAMPYAQEAMRFVQDWVDDNGIEMGAALDRDSFGRIIADIPRLEYELVRAGLAIALPVELSEDAEAVEMFTAAMMAAAEEGAGMFEDEALAARVLSGEVTNLIEFYEEQAYWQGIIIERNTAMFAGYKTADSLLSPLEEAYRDLEDAQSDTFVGGAKAAEEAQERIVAAQEAIQESLEQTALVAFEAALQQQKGGVLLLEQYLDLEVALGNMTEAEAESRIELYLLTEQMGLLGTSFADTTLTAEQQAVALELLRDGHVKTKEEAERLAGTYRNVLSASLHAAAIEAERVGAALVAASGHYAATFDVTYNTYREERGGTGGVQHPDEAVPGLASGGYTGDGAASDVAGIVHAGEFVFSAPAVDAFGVDTLNTMHQAARSGGAVAPLVAETGSTSSTELPPIVMNFYGQTEPEAVYDAASDALEMARAMGRA